jgi:hypothetical protein
MSTPDWLIASVRAVLAHAGDRGVVPFTSQGVTP